MSAPGIQIAAATKPFRREPVSMSRSTTCGLKRRKARRQAGPGVAGPLGQKPHRLLERKAGRASTAAPTSGSRPAPAPPRPARPRGGRPPRGRPGAAGRPHPQPRGRPACRRRARTPPVPRRRRPPPGPAARRRRAEGAGPRRRRPRSRSVPGASRSACRSSSSGAVEPHIRIGAWTSPSARTSRTAFTAMVAEATPSFLTRRPGAARRRSARVRGSLAGRRSRAGW